MATPHPHPQLLTAHHNTLSMPHASTVPLLFTIILHATGVPRS
eukprot:CAMPEP_0180325354 /NCGR_PEP_ID=MMETSP0988-20121125/38394_1 /TAXON_ID=697907 /ORGANISM="non described non described, Strain CCMP2293" /LENGTH=42 /DNA_ID= /DNA_START= /DNA_END= /DNA_ORIENTATION=